jgi:hypothetical protein
MLLMATPMLEVVLNVIPLPRDCATALACAIASATAVAAPAGKPETLNTTEVPGGNVLYFPFKMGGQPFPTTGQEDCANTNVDDKRVSTRIKPRRRDADFVGYSISVT